MFKPFEPFLILFVDLNIIQIISFYIVLLSNYLYF